MKPSSYKIFSYDLVANVQGAVFPLTWPSGLQSLSVAEPGLGRTNVLSDCPVLANGFIMYCRGDYILS